jgi:hypothetical protein
MSTLKRYLKGDIITAHSAIDATATSSEIVIEGFNAALVSILITGTGTWKIDLQGRFNTAGTVMNIYDNNDVQLTTDNITASRMKLFVAIPDLITIVATEVVSGATCTVTVQPINV